METIFWRVVVADAYLAWGDLRNCDTKAEPSPTFAPVIRTVPFELAIVDVMWSPAWKWMKPWGDILG
jgi:hypothetical protein